MGEDLTADFDDVLQKLREVPRPYSNELSQACDQLDETAQNIGEAWSGGWMGYMANTYIRDFRAKKPGEHFDTEWGKEALGFGLNNKTTGDWHEYDFAKLVDAIFKEAGVDKDDFDAASKPIQAAIARAKYDLQFIFDVICSDENSSRLCELGEEIEQLESHVSRESMIGEMGRQCIPEGQPIRDMRAFQGGVQKPAHFYVRCWVQEKKSYEAQLTRLIILTERARTLLISTLGRGAKRGMGNKIFIGHGGKSHVWKDLRHFLDKTLGLDVDEFNMEPTAGITIAERLEKMLDEAGFAFLVMTGEDEHADATRHARTNVIHEVGLFQGRLGFRRAIILLEEGCEEFSNIHGVGQIRFPAGNIDAKSEDIRKVLAREGYALDG